MRADLILRIAAQIPEIVCIKAEAVPSPPKIATLKAKLTREIPILTGLGALYGFFDLERGSVGFNTGFAFPEILLAMVRSTTRPGNPQGNPPSPRPHRLPPSPPPRSHHRPSHRRPTPAPPRPNLPQPGLNQTPPSRVRLKEMRLSGASAASRVNPAAPVGRPPDEPNPGHALIKRVCPGLSPPRSPRGHAPFRRVSPGPRPCADLRGRFSRAFSEEVAILPANWQSAFLVSWHTYRPFSSDRRNRLSISSGSKQREASSSQINCTCRHTITNTSIEYGVSSLSRSNHIVLAELLKKNSSESRSAPQGFPGFCR